MRTDITVHPHERVDDLHRDGHHIIQDPKRFCFGVDAVILAGYNATLCYDRNRMPDDG